MNCFNLFPLLGYAFVNRAQFLASIFHRHQPIFDIQFAQKPLQNPHLVSSNDF